MSPPGRRRRPGPATGPAPKQLAAAATTTATTNTAQSRTAAGTVAYLDEYRARRDERAAAIAAYLHLDRHGLVSSETARTLGLTPADVRRVRRLCSGGWGR